MEYRFIDGLARLVLFLLHGYFLLFDGMMPLFRVRAFYALNRLIIVPHSRVATLLPHSIFQQPYPF